MNSSATVAIAQLDLVVGDVSGNTERIIDAAAHARDGLRADLVVFPELSICGYPPEDLLFHKGLRHAVDRSLQQIRESISGIAVLVGFPEYEGEHTFNSCAVINDGKVLAHYRKRRLPNYAVFDEERYFTAGKSPAVFVLNGIRFGLQICEDVWQSTPIAESRSAGAECIIAINGSPYETDSQRNRETVISRRIDECGVPVMYVNMVGGQDELVFDGGSFLKDADGETRFRAPAFEQGLFPVELRASAGCVEPQEADVAPLLAWCSASRAASTRRWYWQSRAMRSARTRFARS
jgi:NAD+ synthase (glutamine-hydrolysing)